MKVALVMYTGGGLSGGAAKYLRRMVPRLLEDAAIGDLHVYLPRGALSDIPAHWPLSEWEPGPSRGRIIRRLVDKQRPDVVFVPTARWVEMGAAATVVMVRNMEPLEMPETRSRLAGLVRHFPRRMAARLACARADRVIAVSEHVADWLHENWSLDGDKLAIVPHGVDPAEVGIAPPGAAALAGRKFAFSAGSIRPARGLTDLLEAMALPDFPADLHLAFAGSPDPDTQDFYARLLSRVDDLGLGERIHWLGQCGREQMNWGFANCDLFVMTSRAEACPNTVLEALAHGCLSVSCDTPPMPEFFGSAALYYESGDPTSLASAARKVLALPAKSRGKLQAEGRERAAEFTWDRCAERTVAVLREVANVREEGGR